MTAAEKMAAPPNELSYLIHHAFLPPQLPDESDYDPKYEKFLLNTVVQNLENYRSRVPDHQQSIGEAVTMLRRMEAVHECSGDRYRINNDALVSAMQDLDKNGGSVPVHVSAQNAGVFISLVDDRVVVEAFEVSPQNNHVIATKGRLSRTFPASALSIPRHIFQDANFLSTFASTLATMSQQLAKGTQPEVSKAGRKHAEYRDTTHPKMVTELLMAILMPHGIPATTSPIWKNTRDEVNYRSSLQPWRRSPLWLVIRVSLQLNFHRIIGNSEKPSVLYKDFMIYNMANILSQAQSYNYDSDLFLALSAKIRRRLVKLGTTGESTRPDVHKVLHQNDSILEEKRRFILASDSPQLPLQSLSELNFWADTSTRVPDLDQFISDIGERSSNHKRIEFRPKFGWIGYHADELPALGHETSKSEHLMFELAAFEAWVADNFRPWLNKHCSDGNVCGDLRFLIATYHEKAQIQYHQNPEFLSKMLLTIMELWIGCDEAAILACPLLREYDPEIPHKLLQNLLLPLKSQMRRLDAIESYLIRRMSESKYISREVFQSFGGTNCFSVRWYLQSKECHTLMDRIVEWAEQCREKKRTEWREKKAEYEYLMRLSEPMQCHYVPRWSEDDGMDIEYHSDTCAKCAYQEQADSIKIAIHEWPLPSDTLQAQSTVFELQVPVSFGHWRDVTTFLLLNILGSRYGNPEKPQYKCTPDNYTELSKFFTLYGEEQRIQALSEKKPHGVTHRDVKNINVTTEDSVCLNNALSYRYFDRYDDSFVGSLSTTGKILDLCTHKMPADRAALQQFINRPPDQSCGPTPNQVLALQYACPDGVSLDEFKALASIPLGFRVQWQNILVQLHNPSINFKKPETTLIILQCIHQTGPRSNQNVLRESHNIMMDQRLVSAFLEGLEDSLSRIRENWQSSQALLALISLAGRIHTIDSAPQHKKRCLNLLSVARTIAMGWIDILKEKAQLSINDEERANLRQKAAIIALVSSTSFYLEQGALESLLSSSETASIFLQCSMIIHEEGESLSNVDDLTSLLFQRWQALAYHSCQVLSKNIVQEGAQSLDETISRSWPAYQSRSRWQAVSSQYRNWLKADVTSPGVKDTLKIHFNLLDGELLVNGRSLTRLPAEYERHAMYGNLFGQVTIELMPTAIPGMSFSGKDKFAGCTLHFGMSTESDLLVRAVTSHGTYELVPSRLLQSHFPIAFVEERCHWYSVEDDSVIFQSLHRPWEFESQECTLKRAGPGESWRLSVNKGYLINVNSNTAKVVGCVFESLETTSHIHCIVDETAKKADIKLPRLDLGFYMDSGAQRIHSRQYRGMFVDENQSLRSLLGLRSKLILTSEAALSPRKAIIPYGHASYNKSAEHVTVHIDKNSAVKAYAYQVDTLLEQLRDDGSLLAKLWLCYLHALTSFCLPDGLTKKTGTEQALTILRSAGVKSFDSISNDAMDILGKIAHLTPRRAYYPTNERVMQVVKWSPQLGFLAQHGDFHTVVQQLLDKHKRARLFCPDSCAQYPEMHGIDQHLLMRDNIRSSTFRVADFGADHFTVQHDSIYPARDHWEDTNGVDRVVAIVGFLMNGENQPNHTGPDDLATCAWRYLTPHGRVLNEGELPAGSRMTYDSKWLSDSSQFISENWIKLHRALGRGSVNTDKARVMMWLGTLAYANTTPMPILHILGAFHRVQSLKQMELPTVQTYDLKEGAKVTVERLDSALEKLGKHISDTPAANIVKYNSEQMKRYKQRQKREYHSNKKEAMNRLVAALMDHWPASSVDVSLLRDRQPDWSAYYDTDHALQHVQPIFRSCYDNIGFFEYLQLLAIHINTSGTPLTVQRPLLSSSPPDASVPHRFISIESLFSGRAPSRRYLSPPDMEWALRKGDDEEDGVPRVLRLLTELRPIAEFEHERAFVHALEFVRETLRCRPQEMTKPSTNVQAEEHGGLLSGVISEIESRADSKYQSRFIEIYKISHQEQRSRPREARLRVSRNILWRFLHLQRDYYQGYLHQTYAEILSATGVRDAKSTSGVQHWPRISPLLFLQQLSKKKAEAISSDWMNVIVQYGLAASFLQQTQRRLASIDRPEVLLKELGNTGHSNWDAWEHPEALLLEIESDITIRGVQEQIAQQMRVTSCEQNQVMQLNMGEGKSSVIVPIVATALADGEQLVRVIVAKPQAKQMFDILVSKLGGLLHRPVYHMPFSRAVRLGVSDLESVASMFEACRAEGGVLLVQPEHILSFRLMAFEQQIMGNLPVSRAAFKLLNFLNATARDIVDESDENFNVKLELIYTMGTQRPIDHSPGRWTCIHEVLGIIRQIAPKVHSELPDSIEISSGCQGSFSRTRILHEDARNRIIELLAERICQNGLTGFPISRQPAPVRKAVFTYMTKTEITAKEIAEVENSPFWSDAVTKTLLLLRGLLAEGVLAFAFAQKRWRVDYGLVNDRQPPTKVAVPYRAKDSPSARSEFSHPDVVIILTTLSYYYGGLSNQDLFAAFNHLCDSDQADMEYQMWVRDADGLPKGFEQLSSINLEDTYQCTKRAFPRLRFGKAVVDYFLTHIVFPKEMKEFPYKLSASGWDIGEIKGRPLTGFSGTNDSRDMLPLSVNQLDLRSQRHTNALVLEYLLRPENSLTFVESVSGEASGTDAERLLSMVTAMEPPVRVILDVGAQILELNNLEMATEWLKLLPDDESTKAVVFFDDADEMCVVDRKGFVEPLKTSPYSGQLEACLVFLDEAHTRGTDLKLPRRYRAAVTLGANLTKDRLVQACMRMRELGKGQSVVFCVPREIGMKMQARSGCNSKSDLTVADIIKLAISETWQDAGRNMPIWKMQGTRFREHQELWERALESGGLQISEDDAHGFLEDEAQSMEKRYKPVAVESRSEQDTQSQSDDPLVQRCRDFGRLDHRPASLREEQERELAPEVEQERQVQRVPAAKPLPHSVHRDLDHFVSTGVLRKASDAWMTAFESLCNTSAAAHLDSAMGLGEVLVTADFAKSIEGQDTNWSYISDSFQRSVQWILTGPHKSPTDSIQRMVVISPHEAQVLLPDIMKSKLVALHLYAPRPNLGYRSLDSLDLFTVPARPTSRIPQSLIIELNLFAGQLYFESFEEYTRVCRYLGVDHREAKDMRNVDGSADDEDLGASPFKRNPVMFFKLLLTKIRRNCEGIDKTHLGCVLDGRLLTPGDFEKRRE